MSPTTKINRNRTRGVTKREEKIMSIERELEKLRAKVAVGERDIRRTLKPLREVWLEVGQPRRSDSEGTTR